ncbi:unnamed protein product, partial [Rotaria socialis]
MYRDRVLGLGLGSLGLDSLGETLGVSVSRS